VTCDIQVMHLVRWRVRSRRAEGVRMRYGCSRVSAWGVGPGDVWWRVARAR